MYLQAQRLEHILFFSSKRFNTGRLPPARVPWVSQDGPIFANDADAHLVRRSLDSKCNHL